MEKYFRTDLACETPRIESYSKADGILFSRSVKENYEILHTEILNAKGSKIANRKIGKYATLCAGRMWKYLSAELSELKKILRDMIYDFILRAFEKPKSVIISGLGNRLITSDSIGPSVIDKMTATRHLKDTSPHIFKQLGYCEISLLAPGVIGESGISAFDKIQLLSNFIKPDLVILIDSLASAGIERLLTTIQISDAGIVPGSGIGSNQYEISKQTLNIPVISIGVPTVISASSLVSQFITQNQIVNLDGLSGHYLAPNNCNEAIGCISGIIADALQEALMLT